MTMLRVPADVRAELKRRAVEQGRSPSAVAVELIEDRTRDAHDLYDLTGRCAASEARPRGRMRLLLVHLPGESQERVARAARDTGVSYLALMRSILEAGLEGPSGGPR